MGTTRKPAFARGAKWNNLYEERQASAPLRHPRSNVKPDGPFTLTTRSLTPPPSPPPPRLGQRASNSSKKIMHGDDALALWNTCLTDFSDSPTYLSNSSGPEITKQARTAIKVHTTCVVPYGGEHLCRSGNRYKTVMSSSACTPNVFNYNRHTARVVGTYRHAACNHGVVGNDNRGVTGKKRSYLSRK